MVWLVLVTKYSLIRDVEGVGLIFGMTVNPVFAIAIIGYLSACSRRMNELSKFDRFIFYTCWVCLIGIPILLTFVLPKF